MYCRKKGPTVLLKDSFGLIVSDELVAAKRGGNILSSEETFAVIDLNAGGELKRAPAERMVRVERILLPADGHREGGRMCSSVLDLLDLDSSQVWDIVDDIFLQVKPIPREEVEAVRNSLAWKLITRERKHVRKIISMVMLCDRNTQASTWRNVTALGKVFVKQTVNLQGSNVVPRASPGKEEYDAALDEFDKYPSFDELLSQLKKEAAAAKKL